MLLCECGIMYKEFLLNGLQLIQVLFFVWRHSRCILDIVTIRSIFCQRSWDRQFCDILPSQRHRHQTYPLQQLNQTGLYQISNALYHGQPSSSFLALGHRLLNWRCSSFWPELLRSYGHSRQLSSARVLWSCSWGSTETFRKDCNISSHNDITSCSCRVRCAQPGKSVSRSASSFFSSRSFSSRSFSFSRRARARASNPAFKSFCFFFSLRPSSSSWEPRPLVCYNCKRAMDKPPHPGHPQEETRVLPVRSKGWASKYFRVLFTHIQ